MKHVFKIKIAIKLFLIGSIVLLLTSCRELNSTAQDYQYLLNALYVSIAIIAFSQDLIRDYWMKPIINIDNRAEKVICDSEEGFEYIAYRMIIKNSGRRAAKNCKGYIVKGNRQERVCWTVPSERPNATINRDDEERLDICAYYHSGGQIGSFPAPTFISPNEKGWPDNDNKIKAVDCRDLLGIEKCEIIITADNAKPQKKRIIFNEDEKKIDIFD